MVNLRQCPKCNAQISIRAIKCPKCGLSEPFRNDLNEQKQSNILLDSTNLKDNIINEKNSKKSIRHIKFFRCLGFY